MLASVPAAVAVLQGPDHVMVAHNELYRRLVGAERNMIGIPVAEALPEVVDQGFIDLLDAVFRTGEPFTADEMEISLARGEGGEPERVWLDFAYIATRDEAGIIDGIIAHIIDVSSFVRARDEAVSLTKELDIERSRLQEVVEQLRAGVAIADSDGRLIMANRSWRDTFGMEDAELAEIRGVADYVAFVGYRTDGSAYAPTEYPIARALLNDEKVRDERIRFTMPNGSERVIDLTATRIRSRAEDPIAAMVTTIDMTEHLALERELAEGRRREVEADRRRAYEINDTVVQRLAVADLAFGLGRNEEAIRAVRDALSLAKQLISDWGGSSTDLVLSRPAAATEAAPDDQ